MNKSRTVEVRISTRCLTLLVVVLTCFAPFSVTQEASAAPQDSATKPPGGEREISSQLSNAFGLYRTGDFEHAALNYREILKANPSNAEAYAWLARTLLKEKKNDEAREVINTGLQKAESPPVHVALGEVEFREGLISEAEREWVNVLNSGHPDARAYLGLARVSTALSLYKRANTMLKEAHRVDPSDEDVRKQWMNTLSRSERIAFLQEYLSHGNAEDNESRGHLQEYLEYLKARDKAPRSGCHLVSTISSTETPMLELMSDPQHLRGYGIGVEFGDHRSKLLLDTGAGGILINRRLAEKAGLQRLSSTSIGGIGDKGDMNGYVAVAPSIKVGNLEFKDCPVEVADRRSVAEEDGLIGADVFEKFLVDLDFAHEKVRLSELPSRPDRSTSNLSLNSEEDETEDKEEANENKRSDLGPKAKPEKGPFDRYIAPEMKSYTPVLRFGHLLLVPTAVNDDKKAKFFLIDSGDFTTQMSLNAAREVTKVRGESEITIKGLSGAVNKVYTAEKATLTFAHLRQPGQDLLVLDLKHLSDHVGLEVSGIIGFTTLRFLDVKIDYRDGLVWMDYQGPKWLVR